MRVAASLRARPPPRYRDDPTRRSRYAPLVSADSAPSTDASPGPFTKENPFLRPTARVILLDPAGRVLLFRTSPDFGPRRRVFWFTPGGGVEAGESYAEAAARELREETGIADARLGPCVWLREHTSGPWTTGWIRSVERYFVAWSPTTEVSADSRTVEERWALAEHRWWEVGEIGSSPEMFVPRDFAALVAPLARGDVPAAPIPVGR